jgi:hypothetical protein
MNRPNVNYRGPDWALFEEWAADELHETYKRLADLNADDRSTQQLRGRAALLAQILGFSTIPTAAR